jgi:hypothetical protein
MNTLSIVISIVLAAMLALLAIGLPLAILRNQEKGHERRRLLAEGVEGLRLGKMLDGLGKDRDRYLHLERVVDIEQQMHRCGNCDAIEQCDDLLGKDEPVRPEVAGFCPNMDELRPQRTGSTAKG